MVIRQTSVWFISHDEPYLYCQYYRNVDHHALGPRQCIIGKCLAIVQAVFVKWIILLFSPSNTDFLLFSQSIAASVIRSSSSWSWNEPRPGKSTVSSLPGSDDMS
ncbi:hypothetical protein VFPPC_02362 [Pochonia chlamydosporia 170]|uniref:Uncharacterized protein n=1 Tax=Pochonia chlamydosporia 170 TaxID=1380566 RepID=A0A179FX28_METCM|nr:hypothetical protein VFPPC_02362 [Pochonia chlamydosporia 170]OAQ69778.1 hypothetical protein VFPPC_02362 [Pochonia chlamydosporia 170]